MKRYKHEHIYVYQFELAKRDPYIGVEKCEYVLCTNIDGPKHKENTKTLETMLRTVYGFMPKGVKFLYEKK
jgi:hypothetical protein